MDRVPEVVVSDCKWSFEYRKWSHVTGKWSDRVPEVICRAEFQYCRFCGSLYAFRLSVCLSVRYQLFSETTGPIAMKFGRNHLDWIPQGGFSHFFDIALRCLATG